MTDTIEFDTEEIIAEQAREAVAKGAALLDERNPGWDAKIDLDGLYVGDSTECVLGQLYGRYLDGQTELGLSNSQGVSYGFDTWFRKEEHPDEQYDMGDLQTAWEELINERRFK